MIGRRISASLLWRGGLAVCTALLLLRESLAPSSAIVPSDAPGQPATISSAAKPGVLGEAPIDYPSIVAHPLFDPSRRPWTSRVLPSANAPAAPATASKAPPQGYVLVGIVTGLHHRSALLRDPAGKTVFLGEGQLLTGWTVRQITAKGVHFEADNSQFDLLMHPAREMATGRR